MMNNNIPESLQSIIDQFSHFPGVGQKSAMRMAMVLLKWSESEVKRLGQNIYELRDKLHLCSQCGALSDTNPCQICANPERLSHMICLVNEWDSMLTIEEGGFYNGKYSILGGLLGTVDRSLLETDRLFNLLESGEVTELVLALGATSEAEATASYVREQVSKRFPAIKISRLAQGIPLGAEVKFMDKETLKQSLAFRQEL